VASNGCVVPFAIDGFAGATAIDTRAAGPTVNEVVPVTLPEVAEIWDVPCAAPLARPLDVMVATLVSDDVQVAEVLRSCVLPSEYVPVAANACVAPLTIDGFAGETAMDTSTAGPTVRVVLAVSPLDMALICEVPSAVPVARPPDVIGATLVVDDAHDAEFVRSWVLPSE
jgi:hypothetical protein